MNDWKAKCLDSLHLAEIETKNKQLIDLGETIERYSDLLGVKDDIISRMKELANMSHEASKREIFALKCLSACLLTAIIVMVIY